MWNRKNRPRGQSTPVSPSVISGVTRLKEGQDYNRGETVTLNKWVVPAFGNHEQEKRRENTFRNIQEMFSGHVDGEVVYMVLSECDWKEEEAIELLLQMSSSAKAAATTDGDSGNAENPYTLKAIARQWLNTGNNDVDAGNNDVNAGNNDVDAGNNDVNAGNNDVDAGNNASLRSPTSLHNDATYDYLNPSAFYSSNRLFLEPVSSDRIGQSINTNHALNSCLFSEPVSTGQFSISTDSAVNSRLFSSEPVSSDGTGQSTSTESADRSLNSRWYDAGRVSCDDWMDCINRTITRSNRDVDHFTAPQTYDPPSHDNLYRVKNFGRPVAGFSRQRSSVADDNPRSEWIADKDEIYYSDNDDEETPVGVPTVTNNSLSVRSSIANDETMYSTTEKLKYVSNDAGQTYDASTFPVLGRGFSGFLTRPRFPSPFSGTSSSDLSANSSSFIRGNCNLETRHGDRSNWGDFIVPRAPVHATAQPRFSERYDYGPPRFPSFPVLWSPFQVTPSFTSPPPQATFSPRQILPSSPSISTQNRFDPRIKRSAKSKNNLMIDEPVSTIMTIDDARNRIVSLLHHSIKVLVLLRGCPGSGKTTLAREIKFSGVVLSADNFFEENGIYRYDVLKIGDAHVWNRQQALKAFTNGKSPVVIDNTNTEMWEMMPYVEMADEFGYHVEVVEPDVMWRLKANHLARHSVHGVPAPKIRSMLNKYEHNVTAATLLKAVRAKKLAPSSSLSAERDNPQSSDSASTDAKCCNARLSDFASSKCDGALSSASLTAKYDQTWSKVDSSSSLLPKRDVVRLTDYTSLSMTPLTQVDKVESDVDASLLSLTVVESNEVEPKLEIAEKLDSNSELSKSPRKKRNRRKTKCKNSGSNIENQPEVEAVSMETVAVVSEEAASMATVPFVSEALVSLETDDTVLQEPISMSTNASASKKLGSVARVESVSTTTEESVSTTMAESVSISTEKSVSISTEKSVSVATEELVSVTTEESVSVATEESVSMTAEESVSVTTEESVSTTAEESISVATEELISMVTKESGSVSKEESVSMTTEEPVSFVTERSVSVATERSVSTTAEESVSVATEESVSVAADVVVTKTGSLVEALEATEEERGSFAVQRTEEGSRSRSEINYNKKEIPNPDSRDRHSSHEEVSSSAVEDGADLAIDGSADVGADLAIDGSADVGADLAIDGSSADVDSAANVIDSFDMKSVELNYWNRVDFRDDESVHLPLVESLENDSKITMKDLFLARSYNFDKNQFQSESTNDVNTSSATNPPKPQRTSRKITTAKENFGTLVERCLEGNESRDAWNVSIIESESDEDVLDMSSFTSLSPFHLKSSQNHRKSSQNHRKSSQDHLRSSQNNDEPSLVDDHGVKSSRTDQEQPQESSLDGHQSQESSLDGHQSQESSLDDHQSQESSVDDHQSQESFLDDHQLRELSTDVHKLWEQSVDDSVLQKLSPSDHEDQEPFLDDQELQESSLDDQELQESSLEDDQELEQLSLIREVLNVFLYDEEISVDDEELSLEPRESFPVDVEQFPNDQNHEKQFIESDQQNNAQSSPRRAAFENFSAASSGFSSALSFPSFASSTVSSTFSGFGSSLSFVSPASIVRPASSGFSSASSVLSSASSVLSSSSSYAVKTFHDVSTFTEATDLVVVHRLETGETVDLPAATFLRVVPATPRVILDRETAMVLRTAMDSRARCAVATHDVSTTTSDDDLHDSESKREFLNGCFPTVEWDDLNDILSRCGGDTVLAVNTLLDSGYVYNEPGRRSSSERTGGVRESVSNCDGVALLNGAAQEKHAATSRNSNGVSLPLRDLRSSPAKAKNDKDGQQQQRQQQQQQRQRQQQQHALKDGTIPLSLTPAFAAQLVQLFGPIESSSPSGFMSENELLIEIDLETAERIHERLSIARKKNSTVGHRLSPGFGGSSPVRRSKSSNLPPLPTHSELEKHFNPLELKRHFNHSKTAIETPPCRNPSETKIHVRMTGVDYEAESLSTRIKRQQLKDRYPKINATILDEIFKATGYSIDMTVKTIETSPELLARPLSVMTKEKEEEFELRFIERAIIESLKDQQSQGGSDTFAERFENSEEVYDDLMSEVFCFYYRCYRERTKQAQEAYNKKMGPVAAHYSHEANRFRDRIREIQETAAEIFVQSKWTDLSQFGSLDLHGLQVKEAIQILSSTLTRKEDELRTDRPDKRRLHLFVITGRGSHSHGGLAKIRPAVETHLKRNNYTFTESSPGVFKVRLKMS